MHHQMVLDESARYTQLWDGCLYGRFNTRAISGLGRPAAEVACLLKQIPKSLFFLCPCIIGDCCDLGTVLTELQLRHWDAKLSFRVFLMEFFPGF